MEFIQRKNWESAARKAVEFSAKSKLNDSKIEQLLANRGSQFPARRGSLWKADDDVPRLADFVVKLMKKPRSGTESEIRRKILENRTARPDRRVYLLNPRKPEEIGCSLCLNYAHSTLQQNVNAITADTLIAARRKLLIRKQIAKQTDDRINVNNKRRPDYYQQLNAIKNESKSQIRRLEQMNDDEKLRACGLFVDEDEVKSHYLPPHKWMGNYLSRKFKSLSSPEKMVSFNKQINNNNYVYTKIRPKSRRDLH
ncbi:unnamed protein product [Dimorphilus gyrociliatus]|uniref:Uncharacterized protein n=1 Tax=Dimorphilus gyrociliatus TaxID=2664684 RepID=A0A7I8VRN5_9ANNE|nr:unnamed protein product [Dimorphilus gyrociliatus]